MNTPMIKGNAKWSVSRLIPCCASFEKLYAIKIMLNRMSVSFKFIFISFLKYMYAHKGIY